MWGALVFFGIFFRFGGEYRVSFGFGRCVGFGDIRKEVVSFVCATFRRL